VTAASIKCREATLIDAARYRELMLHSIALALRERRRRGGPLAVICIYNTTKRISVAAEFGSYGLRRKSS
jgi:hypothetical protein